MEAAGPETSKGEVALCGWKHPRAERASAVLSFLWEKKVGHMMAITLPQEEEGGGKLGYVITVLFFPFQKYH